MQQLVSTIVQGGSLGARDSSVGVCWGRGGSLGARDHSVGVAWERGFVALGGAGSYRSGSLGRGVLAWG